jgi:hypothetical protein
LFLREVVRSSQQPRRFHCRCPFLQENTAVVKWNFSVLMYLHRSVL